MLLLVTLATAGTWNICSTTEATASINAGWTVFDDRNVDGDRALDRGTYSAATSIVRRWQPRHDADLCDHSDGMGGMTHRLDSALVEIDALPGEGTCPVAVWANGYSDAGSSALVSPDALSARVTGHAVTSADAGNTATIGVDGGGGASFEAQWLYTGAGTTRFNGVIDVDASASYNGASLDIPGWAQVDAYDGRVDAWVRRDDQWVHVVGEAPLKIEFGARVSARTGVCAMGSTTSGAHAQPGGQGTGGAGIGFTITPVRAQGAPDVRPRGGPEFEECGC